MAHPPKELTPEAPVPAALPPQATQVERCYRCGARVPPEEHYCPRCRRPQYRVCYCGQQIPTVAEFCANCGADWRNSVRVRRKSQRRRMDRRAAGRAAVAGALAAVIVGLVARSVVTGLAQRALGPEQGLPRDWWGRLGLAAEALGALLARLGHRLLELGSELLPLLALLALGAGAGVLYYLVRTEVVMIRLPWRPRRKSRRKRRADPQ